MPKVPLKLCRALICLFLIQCIVVSANAKEWVHLTPVHGDSSVYYDVDIHGRVMRIDYVNDSAKILGQFDVDWTDHLPLRLVRAFEGQSDLLMLDTSGDAFVLRSGEKPLRTPMNVDFSTDASIALDVSGIGYLYFFDSSSRQPRRMCYIVESNTVESTVDYPFTPYTMFTATPDNQGVFLAERNTLQIHKADARLRKASPLNTSSFTAFTAEGWHTFVIGLFKSQAILKSFPPTRDVMRFAIYDIASDSIVYKSADLPFFTGIYYYECNPDSSITIDCLEQKIVDSKLTYSGQVNRLYLRHSDVQNERITFDPTNEVILRDSNEGWRIQPIKKFDYVSMISVSAKCIKLVGSNALNFKSTYEQIQLRFEELLEDSSIEKELIPLSIDSN